MSSSTAAAESVQDKIDALQKALHAAIAASDFDFDQKRAAIISERDAAVREMIANKDLPENFWATAVVSFLTLRDKESDTMTHFLGPYDEELLKGYLKDVHVTFTPKGFRLTMAFRENPFFEETELWAEIKRVSAKEEAEDAKSDDADDIEDEGFEFSGITWKPGHGPADDDDEEDEESDEEGDHPHAKKTGQKHAREGESERSKTQGPTMLEVFSSMAPFPEDDEELDDLDDDEMADAVDEWESELNDRKLLLALLAEEMLVSPHTAIKGLAEIESLVDELKKKAPRTE